MAARICALCNDSTITATNESEDEDGNAQDGGNGVVRDGSPTEAALRVLAKKISTSLGLSDGSMDVACPASETFSEEFPRVCKLEFSRKRKSMSLLCKAGVDSR